MDDKADKDLGFSVNRSDYGNSATSDKDTIGLELSKTLQSEGIIGFFSANKKTRCIEIGLNHIYSDKTIVSRIYP
ncbi:MAG TPA: hypothetical protein VKA95_03670, partial [Nitrososphaeraceae archaeon]|nr:hypothetical protein [Nitrososphaeraceae archaeon]